MAVVGLLMVGSPAVAGVNDLANGVNSIVTAPLDLAAGVVEPHRYFDAKKANVVTDRIGGVVNGGVIFVKRLVLGLVDVVTFPVTELVKGSFSPDARFRVLGVEADAAVE
jgi:hypothetical protein